MHGEKARWELDKNAMWTNLESNNQQNSSFTATYLPSQKSSKYDKQDMWNSAGEARMNSYVMFFYGHL